MCRFLAYSGPAMTLDQLVLAPEHSLLRQSYAPRFQQHGTINADGWGIGWYAPDVRDEPARYRTTKPLWSDTTFASMAGVIASDLVVAAVRSATPPLPTEESSTPPFTSGRWLFAHNGVIDDFHEGVGTELRRGLPGAREADIEGASDSELLFALVLSELDQGSTPADAITAAVQKVTDLTKARLNVVLSDGHSLVAGVWGDTLFTRVDGAGAGMRTYIASEPFDEDDAWQPVADASLVLAGRGRPLTAEPLLMETRPIEGP